MARGYHIGQCSPELPRSAYSSYSDLESLYNISLKESMHFSEDNTEDTGDKLLAQNHTVIP